MNEANIMVVDDSKVDQMIIQNILKGHHLIIAYDGLEAVKKVDEGENIDIIILDLNMPNMNGFEVLEYLKTHHNDKGIPVLILTNYEEIENEIKGLELGAVDYIRKPLNAASLLKRLEVHFNLFKARNEIKEYNMMLEGIVDKKSQQLLMTRDITINALVGILEVRDIESSNHTKRTKIMMKALCEHLSEKEAYKAYLTKDRIEAIFKTTPLHDVGKVGIPDSILLKPGKLTDDEYTLMKEHVRLGVDAINAEIEDEEVDSYLKTAMRIIGYHHEKYDGSGYPNGLIGKNIPLEGRLMAVIDVYDALTSKRIYKKAFPHDESLKMMTAEKGKHFDPDILEAFFEIKEEIHDIAIKYRSKKEGETIEMV